MKDGRAFDCRCGFCGRVLWAFASEPGRALMNCGTCGVKRRGDGDERWVSRSCEEGEVWIAVPAGVLLVLEWEESL